MMSEWCRRRAVFLSMSPFLLVKWGFLYPPHWLLSRMIYVPYWALLAA